MKTSFLPLRSRAPTDLQPAKPRDGYAAIRRLLAAIIFKDRPATRTAELNDASMRTSPCDAFFSGQSR